MGPFSHQLSLFAPTAEGFAASRALEMAPRSVNGRKNGRRAPQGRGMITDWRQVSLSDMSPEEMEAAPSTFKELSRITSIKEAVALCEQFGGLKLRIPPPEEGRRWKNSTLRVQLKALLSAASYERLLDEMGRSGCDVTFPSLAKLKKKRRDQRIREVIDALIAEKKPYLKTLQSIARVEGLHMTTVYKILKQSD